MTARNDALTSAREERAEPLLRKSKRRSPVRESPKAMGALILSALIVLSAVFAPVIAPYDPASQNLALRLNPPSSDHWLGTDQFGRDILSRII